MPRKRRGFSAVELILVGVFLAIFAAIAVPRLSFSGISGHRAETVARKIVTDLRRTRRMAISEAVNNILGYQLNMLGGSPFTGYEIVKVNELDPIESQAIDSDVTVTGGIIFRFGPQGNITLPGNMELAVSGQGKSFTITVIVATGAVICVEN
jgi:type II secretory pathway pseudopilin PulG